MTFNIRYNNPGDGPDRWALRKAEVVELLNYYQPDLLGLQEVLPDQQVYLAQQLASYGYIGHGRDGMGSNSEGTPLFYKKERFELLESDVFWLSETPDRISKGWDAALNRIVVYGVLRDRDSGDTLHVFNCHFDHKGKVAREKSAALLIDLMAQKEILDGKIVLMGDLNSEPEKAPIKILEQHLSDSFYASMTPAYGPKGTFSGFDTAREIDRRIDYIFTRNIQIKDYRCIDDRRSNNRYPSDHLPVLVRL